MVGKVVELNGILKQDKLAEQIALVWDEWNNYRQPWMKECRELRNFIFATDTGKTSNASLPWKNKTTLPKLTQIRDNLHANYMTALFPNDDWLTWEGSSFDDDSLDKAEAIEGYLSNKVKEDNFISTVSKLVYDYIDYGNAFADVEFVNEYREDPITGEKIIGYIGPRLVRYSPFDIVINPTAASFKESPRIVRKIKTFGELKIEAEQSPDKAYLLDALKRSEKVRSGVRAGMYSPDDFNKAEGFSIDGFGDLYTYFQSPYVELLEFEGDIHDDESNTLLTNHRIVIVDRQYVVYKDYIPSWLGKGNKVHVGWRERPDNLYAMGPLHNLMGMQYRIDHLENLRADVFDLIAYPPLKVYGDVEAFDWGPGCEIQLGVDGEDVQMLSPDTTALNADMQIQILEERMEELAGAPKSTMGIRTPGEKTRYEVQSLDNAAGRIYQNKVNAFERNILEPILNSMLEVSRRNMDIADVIRVIDEDLGVTKFLTITKDDITAIGKIRPVGSKHFAAKAQLFQTLGEVFNSPVGQIISPHISSVALAKLIEDTLGLRKFELIRENVAVEEQAETQRAASQSQEDLAVEQSIGTGPGGSI